MFTFVIGSMPIFPTSKQHQMHTKTYMSPIKNQSVQFTSSEKEFWHICNSSEQKIANRQTQTFLKINRARKKVSRLKDENVEKTKFTLLLYSRLPPDNIWPGYDPLKEVYICWGPPFNLKLYWFTWKNCWVIITFIFNI